MLKYKVPQDNSAMSERWREVCYATNQDGKYEKVLSNGWEVKEIVNRQAWDLLNEKTQAAKHKVLAGKLSPLAYHMIKNQMDCRLLAEYAGIPKRKVKKHLRTRAFAKLKPETIERYALVFGINPDDLGRVPD
jgi:hypothetical protein